MHMLFEYVSHSQHCRIRCRTVDTVRCQKDCSVAVDIFCTGDSICFSLSWLFIIVILLSLIFVSLFQRKQASTNETDVGFSCSYASI